ncbi:MAG: phosphoglycerate dehydrogenase [Candidatus Levyibacteriota bacterium]
MQRRGPEQAELRGSPEIQSTRRILVCDPLPKTPFEALTGYHVDFNFGRSPKELKRIVGGYDALVVRDTAVTADLLSNPGKLSLIVRAGGRVGDVIDVEAATERGIIVANTPDANTNSAAELTIALLFAAARHIPQAHVSLKEGKWDRVNFTGRELRGKTLGVIGIGNVGEEVARKAMGMDMKVVAFDPHVSTSKAEQLGIKVVSSLDSLLAESDVITIHVPLTEETRNLIDGAALAKAKDSVIFINTARGGIVNEKDLLDAINNGKVAGAALDVFEGEFDPELSVHPKIVYTPHLGTSTGETQDRLAEHAAKIITKIFGGETVSSAINMPTISPEAMRKLAPYVELASRIASLALMISPSKGIKKVDIDYVGEIAGFDSKLLKVAVVGGILTPAREEIVNLVNCETVIKREGLAVIENSDTTQNAYTSLIRVKLESEQGETTVEGIIGHDGPRIVKINGLNIGFLLNGHILIVKNDDTPCMIAYVAKVLGEAEINIDDMSVDGNGIDAMMAITVKTPLDEGHIQQIENIVGIDSVHFISFPK